MKMTNFLPLVEQFHSLQGEGYHAGKSAFFVRLAGCKVGCSWCDTKNSWDEKKYTSISIEKIIDRIKIETSINWFENQGMDKGWNRGLHDFFPEAIKKGYLGMIISKHYLPMFPTIAEAKANVLPDTLLVVGTGFKEQMKEFYPGLSVKTAPAFRFQGVYGTFLKHNPSKNISVLVALYSILEEAVTTLNFVFEKF